MAYGFTRVHHVQLAIPPGGEDECRAFWRDLLGMTELAKPPALAARGGCWFRGGGIEVHVGVEEDFAPARKAHPGFLVQDLRALAARLAGIGVTVTWDPDFPGHDRFYCADPFGNRLEFLEPSHAGAGRTATAYVGIDLAWGGRATTGLAVLDGEGRLVDLAGVRTDEELDAWLGPHAGGPCVVAVDAPLVVTNATGRRPAEAELAAVYARFQAGPHPSNTGKPEFASGTRGGRLCARHGLDLDPGSAADRRAIEVYPHPATIALFGLTRTLKYKHKPGRDLASLQGGLLRLVELLEGLSQADPPLRHKGSSAWAALVGQVRGATRKSHLKAVEDRVDAVLCAYLALFADRRPGDVTVFGDAATGAIVTPTLRPPADVIPPGRPGTHPV